MNSSSKVPEAEERDEALPIAQQFHSPRRPASSTTLDEVAGAPQPSSVPQKSSRVSLNSPASGAPTFSLKLSETPRAAVLDERRLGATSATVTATGSMPMAEPSRLGPSGILRMPSGLEPIASQSPRQRLRGAVASNYGNSLQDLLMHSALHGQLEVASSRAPILAQLHRQPQERSNTALPDERRVQFGATGTQTSPSAAGVSVQGGRQPRAQDALAEDAEAVAAAALRQLLVLQVAVSAPAAGSEAASLSALGAASPRDSTAAPSLSSMAAAEAARRGAMSRSAEGAGSARGRSSLPEEMLSPRQAAAPSGFARQQTQQHGGGLDPQGTQTGAAQTLQSPRELHSPLPQVHHPPSQQAALAGQGAPGSLEQVVRELNRSLQQPAAQSSGLADRAEPLRLWAAGGSHAGAGPPSPGGRQQSSAGAARAARVAAQWPQQPERGTGGAPHPPGLLAALDATARGLRREWQQPGVQAGSRADLLGQAGQQPYLQQQQAPPSWMQEMGQSRPTVEAGSADAWRAALLQLATGASGELPSLSNARQTPDAVRAQSIAGWQAQRPQALASNVHQPSEDVPPPVFAGSLSASSPQLPTTGPVAAPAAHASALRLLKRPAAATYPPRASVWEDAERLVWAQAGAAGYAAAQPSQSPRAAEGAALTAGREGGPAVPGPAHAAPARSNLHRVFSAEMVSQGGHTLGLSPAMPGSRVHSGAQGLNQPGVVPGRSLSSASGHDASSSSGGTAGGLEASSVSALAAGPLPVMSSVPVSPRSPTDMSQVTARLAAEVALLPTLGAVPPAAAAAHAGRGGSFRDRGVYAAAAAALRGNKAPSYAALPPSPSTSSATVQALSTLALGEPPFASGGPSEPSGSFRALQEATVTQLLELERAPPSLAGAKRARVTPAGQGQESPRGATAAGIDFTAGRGSNASQRSGMGIAGHGGREAGAEPSAALLKDRRPQSQRRSLGHYRTMSSPQQRLIWQQANRIMEQLQQEGRAGGGGAANEPSRAHGSTMSSSGRGQRRTPLHITALQMASLASSEASPTSTLPSPMIMTLSSAFSSLTNSPPSTEATPHSFDGAPASPVLPPSPLSARQKVEELPMSSLGPRAERDRDPQEKGEDKDDVDLDLRL